MTATQSDQNPIAAVIAVVSFGQKLLLVRRANPPDVGFWGFPGGKIGFGEPIATAATRELREETGIIGAAERILTTLDVLDHASGKVREHYVLVAVQCRYLSGDPLAADDALEARWFTWPEVLEDTLQLSRDVKTIASKVMEKMPTGPTGYGSRKNDRED